MESYRERPIVQDENGRYPCRDCNARATVAVETLPKPYLVIDACEQHRAKAIADVQAYMVEHHPELVQAEEVSFGYSHDGEMFYGNCPTREAALAEGIQENPDAWNIWTARRVALDLAQCFPPAYHLLDTVRDSAADVTVVDVLDAVSPEAEKRLDEALRATFRAWLKAEGFDKYWTAEDDERHIAREEPQGV